MVEQPARPRLRGRDRACRNQYPTREPDLVGPQADPADEFLRLACLTDGADDPVRRTNAAAMLAGPGRRTSATPTSRVS